MKKIENTLIKYNIIIRNNDGSIIALNDILNTYNKLDDTNNKKILKEILLNLEKLKMKNSLEKPLVN